MYPRSQHPTTPRIVTGSQTRSRQQPKQKPKPDRPSAPSRSREAAQECSPQLALSLSKGRKPWVRSGRNISPEGAQDGLRHRFRQGRHSTPHQIPHSPQHRPMQSRSSARLPQPCTGISLLPQPINSFRPISRCATASSPSHLPGPFLHESAPPPTRTPTRRPSVEKKSTGPHLGRHCWRYNIWCFPLDRHNPRE